MVGGRSESSVPVPGRENGGKSVALSTLGCKVNQVETEEIKQALIDRGYRIVGADEPADFCVINTCTVTGRSDFESRNLVRRAVRRSSRVRIIVTGCYAQRDGMSLSRMPNVAAVVGVDRKADIPAILEGLDGESRGIMDVGDISGSDRFSSYPIVGIGRRTRAYLKVQDGCRGGCSFCIVPSVRGPSRSRPLPEAIRAASLLVEKGFKEIVLCGIQLGYYGRDLKPPVPLTRLVEEITGLDGLKRVRLSSLKPDLVDDELVDLVTGHPSVCRHLHLSLQSADDAVLRLMNRRYTASRLERLLSEIHRKSPETGIGADTIVGHPGETDRAFENTYQRIKDWPIAFMHVFRYSDRPGTDSERLPDRVPAEVKKERGARLRKLVGEKQSKFRNRFPGKSLNVLVERARDGLASGLSDNYLRVRFDGDAEVGGLYPVLIKSIDGNYLVGGGSSP